MMNLVFSYIYVTQTDSSIKEITKLRKAEDYHLLENKHQTVTTTSTNQNMFWKNGIYLTVGCSKSKHIFSQVMNI